MSPQTRLLLFSAALIVGALWWIARDVVRRERDFAWPARRRAAFRALERTDTAPIRRY
jgi:hypothetical protein